MSFFSEDFVNGSDIGGEELNWLKNHELCKVVICRTNLAISIKQIIMVGRISFLCQSLALPRWGNICRALLLQTRHLCLRLVQPKWVYLCYQTFAFPKHQRQWCFTETVNCKIVCIHHALKWDIFVQPSRHSDVACNDTQCLQLDNSSCSTRKSWIVTKSPAGQRYHDILFHLCFQPIYWPWIYFIRFA